MGLVAQEQTDRTAQDLLDNATAPQKSRVQIRVKTAKVIRDLDKKEGEAVFRSKGYGENDMAAVCVHACVLNIVPSQVFWSSLITCTVWHVCEY